MFAPDPVKSAPSGKRAGLPIPAATFADNTSYSWRVRAIDGRDGSAWTTTCRFTVDSSKPAQPIVSSDDYPTGSDGLPARTPGRFTFSPPPGSTGDDVPACYVYALNVAPPTTVPCSAPNTQAASVAPAADGTARDIPITPTRVGSNTLYVYARDRAGNPSISEPAKDGYDFTTADLLVPDKPGDFSGDGRPDLLAVGKSTHSGLWLHRGNPDGTVQAATQIGQNGTSDASGTPAAWTGAITTHADFDGDGAQDLLARTNDGNLAIYLGTGDASPFDTAPPDVGMPVCLVNTTDDDDDTRPLAYV